MKTNLNNMIFLLDGFGFTSVKDFTRSTFKLLYVASGKVLLCLSAALGFLVKMTGMEAPVLIAFIALIAAETITGTMVARKVKGEKIKSRKMGRMALKIFVYLFMLGLLFTFSQHIPIPEVMGFALNPFVWLYYATLVAILFQFFISFLENLGCLGYAETKTLAGFVLRKLNKYFEMDGTKYNDKTEQDDANNNED